MKKRWKWLLIITLFAAAIGLGLFAYPRPEATLTDLRSVEELRTRFNHDKGKSRLILLLAPT
ncbi:MAG: hypothetical protein M3410_03505 [Acidobacteriota bacterium]|nr:hypothetical protein [Acidobacteriota bacterium]